MADDDRVEVDPRKLQALIGEISGSTADLDMLTGRMKQIVAHVGLPGSGAPEQRWQRGW